MTRPIGLTPDEQRVWDLWVSLSLVGIPLVSYAWPPADAVNRGMKWTVNELRGHLLADHGGYLESSRDYVRLKRQHDEAHEDPLWSHVVMMWDRMHVHEESTTSPKEDEEWSW